MDSVLDSEIAWKEFYAGVLGPAFLKITVGDIFASTQI
jgi:hypothetical protein